MTNPHQGRGVVERKNSVSGIRILAQPTATDQPLKRTLHPSLKRLSQKKRLSDSLHWLERKGIIGDQAIAKLTSTYRGGEP